MRFLSAIILMFSLLAVGGCSTPYDLKKTKPVISYTTTRPAKDVMKCIRDNWRKHQTTVYETKTDSGYIIRHDDVLPAATVAIVTIEGTEPEVKVEYFHRTSKLKLHDLEEDIISCK